MTKRILERSKPNGHYVSLNQEDDWFFVLSGGSAYDDSDDFETEFETLEEAKAFYESERTRLFDTPNWDAQAAYDEANGTDNGYAPWQLDREY